MMVTITGKTKSMYTSGLEPKEERVVEWSEEGNNRSFITVWMSFIRLTTTGKSYNIVGSITILAYSSSKATKFVFIAWS